MGEKAERRVACIRAQEHAAAVPEATARDSLSYEVWGGDLSREQFLSREAMLWRHPFSQRGMRVWLLRAGDEVLAGCESFVVPCTSRGVRGLAHGIASVFVEERLRGRGHASELVRGVNAQLADEGALCTYLMSEVAPTIYARLGFVARPVRVRRLAALQAPIASTVDWIAVTQLDDALLPALGDALSLQIDRDFVSWHIARGWFHADVCGRPRQTILGPRVGNTWTICADEPSESLLRVLALRCDGDPQALAQVLSATCQLAAQQGLSSVEIWENEQNRALPFAADLRAEDLAAIPMLCPLQPGIDARDWQSCERGHWL
ncbi:MAG: GNAT family N-acetyltransferase [Myxococcales bacterium]|nr:GNAT family N-acetyltransferase [Myxococcales bacterium]